MTGNHLPLKGPGAARRMGLSVKLFKRCLLLSRVAHRRKNKYIYTFVGDAERWVRLG